MAGASKAPDPSELHSALPLPGLERSCAVADAPGGGQGERPGDWVRQGVSRPGFERYEARFAGPAFEPHRHDTYAVGITVQGMQAFGYRGGSTVSLAGQVVVLHPDEPHDGRAGSEAGFRYRILYLEPRLLRAALGETAPLPFVPGGVSDDPWLRSALIAALEDLDSPLEDIEVDQLVESLAEALSALDRSAPRRAPRRGDLRRLEVARALLSEELDAPLGSAALEAATGLDRYDLARQFRARYGISPHRYRVLRRLDRVRALIRTGTPLGAAALEAGFADQSHMTRQFKKAYGLPPGRWAALGR